MSSVGIKKKKKTKKSATWLNNSLLDVPRSCMECPECGDRAYVVILCPFVSKHVSICPNLSQSVLNKHSLNYKKTHLGSE